MPDNQTNEQPQGPPQIDTTGLVKDGKLLGKYESAEALEQGYFNAVTEMNKAKENLGMAMQVIQQLQASGPPQASTPMTPAYEKALADMGIPVDPVRALVTAEAAKIASEIVKKQLSPMVEGANAQSYMEATYPDYRENVKDIMRFVRNKPDLARRFDSLLDGDRPTEALELGYLHWKNSGAATRTSPETEAAKRAAAGTQSAAGAGRTAGVSHGPSQAEVDAAYKEFYAGNAVPLINLKLGNTPLTYSEHMEALMRGKQ